MYRMLFRGVPTLVVIAAIVACSFMICSAPPAVHAGNESLTGSGDAGLNRSKTDISLRSVMLAANTEQFKWKEGFVREPKDVLNTLRSNEITSFQNFRDGLQQAFGLDEMLKGTGPYTVFAPSDKAFKRMADEDYNTLFADKMKLKKVMSYHIVLGLLKSADLKVTPLLNTMEGHQLKVNEYNGSLYVNNILVTICDIPCTNGVVHVVDRVLIPAENQ